MENCLSGKVALVTGAARGLGRASARAFARAGASVVVSDCEPKGGQETVSLIRQDGGEAQFVRADVSDEAQVEALIAAVIDTYGRIDVAHNNAGILGVPGNVVTYPTDEWNRVIATNMTSVWLCMKYQIPRMRDIGGGAIVNTASIGGMFAAENSAAYVTAKHGVIGMSRSAALDFGPDGIRVNALLPGATATPMLEPSAVAAKLPLSEMTRRIPLRRISQPEEQADAAVWLCSPQASFVTGIALVVDGGITMQV